MLCNLARTSGPSRSSSLERASYLRDMVNTIWTELKMEKKHRRKQRSTIKQENYRCDTRSTREDREKEREGEEQRESVKGRNKRWVQVDGDGIGCREERCKSKAKLRNCKSKCGNKSWVVMGNDG